MTGLTGLFLLLLLPSLALAGSTGDAVNERIPVNAAEMEAHWQVDCNEVRNSLLATAKHPSSEHDCGITPDLRRDTQLCAFIYQAPGKKAQHKCPDYSGVSKRLQQVTEPTLCNNLLLEIRGKITCRPKDH